MSGKLNPKMEEIGCCVLLPTYNNGTTLGSVLGDLLSLTTHIIIVNDGSTDNTAEILSEYPEIIPIHFDRNQGKGMALRAGFEKALEKGYTSVISIDSDGQHSASDLENFLAEAESHPGSLIMGARNMDQEGIPGKSSFGNRFSNFWFWVETGYRLPDTQTGYRMYPVRRLGKKKYFTRRFEFEIEVLVRAAWQGINIRSIPVKVYYPPPGERVSHFRPFKDFFRISILNTLLVLLALLYFRPVMFFRDFNYEKFRRLTGKGEPAVRLAIAIGFGVFMGIVPIWGWQMIVAGFLAHFFKLNKALVLLASNISFGPMVAVVIYLSFLAGRIFVNDPVNLIFNASISLEHIKIALVQYIAGSVLLAVTAGLVSGLAAYILIRIRRNGQKL